MNLQQHPELPAVLRPSHRSSAHPMVVGSRGEEMSRHLSLHPRNGRDGSGCRPAARAVEILRSRPQEASCGLQISRTNMRQGSSQGPPRAFKLSVLSNLHRSAVPPCELSQ
jgi:hypothetical protein